MAGHFLEEQIRRDKTETSVILSAAKDLGLRPQVQRGLARRHHAEMFRSAQHDVRPAATLWTKVSRYAGRGS